MKEFIDKARKNIYSKIPKPIEDAERKFAEVKKTGKEIAEKAKELIDEIRMLNGGEEDLWFRKEKGCK